MHRNADFAAAVCRAANDWMIEEWLALDERPRRGDRASESHA